jgi:ketosteroid isomerase-like protein
MENTEVIRELARRWNAGDVDGVLDLYAEDAVMHSGEDWPEQASWHGHDGMRANIEEWLATWERADAEIDSIEEYPGDQVIATGAWNARGRLSGVSGKFPIAMLFTMRDGKIATVEWFPDHERAVAAARDA